MAPPTHSALLLLLLLPLANGAPTPRYPAFHALARPTWHSSSSGMRATSPHTRSLAGPLSGGAGARTRTVVSQRVLAGGLTMSGSAADQYAAAMAERNRDMHEMEAKRAMTESLQEAGEGRGLSREYWRGLARGLTVADDSSSATVAGIGGRSAVKNGQEVAVAIQGERSRELLAERGFTKFEGVEWEALGVDMANIAATMQNLKDEGWPPVFVFMYDETWRMCEGLFDVLGPLIGDNNVELEASVYGWALEKPTGEEKVGGNFGQPHRDQGFNTCHLADGSSSILSVWVPTVDATLDNGCMYVVPRECDPLFQDFSHQSHLAPHTFNFPFQSIRPLPGEAGSVLCWHPNTIHWGSAVSQHSPVPPRKSLAMAFRVPESRQAFTEKEMDACGRVPFTRQELSNGVSMKERWNLCAKGVLMYSVWHPDFIGFDVEKNLQQ